jgi:hypothetical protein
MFRTFLFLASIAASSADSLKQSQSLDCGVGGKQSMDLMSTYTSKVKTNSTFDVSLGGNPSKPGAVEGSAIKALEWYFVIPSGLSPAGNPTITSQGSVVTGSGTLGTVSVSYSGSVITLKASGTINDHSSFVPPGFTMKFKATGNTGSKVNIISQANPAYKLNAVVNVNCKVDGSTVAWTDITIS